MMLIMYLEQAMKSEFGKRKEGRHPTQQDIRSLRDTLHEFLGEPKARFAWLENVSDSQTAGGAPSPDDKAHMIAEWVTKHAPHFPKEKHAPMYQIAGIALQLARGDRHVLEAEKGSDAIADAWNKLDEYERVLTAQLHGF